MQQPEQPKAAHGTAALITAPIAPFVGGAVCPRLMRLRDAVGDGDGDDGDGDDDEAAATGSNKARQRGSEAGHAALAG